MSFRDTRESSRYAAKQQHYLSSTLRIGFSREIVKQGFLLCGVYNGKTSVGDTACGVNSIFLKTLNALPTLAKQSRVIDTKNI